MALLTRQVPVGTTAVELTSRPVTDPSNSIAVQAPAAATLWVGPAGVTAATGFPVAAGQTLALDLGPGERLYGILASGSGTAYALATGV